MAKNIEPKFIVGLEVGTSKVVAVVGEVLADGTVNVLGYGSSPSKGMDRGNINDLIAVRNSIERAVEAAESVADCHIKYVSLAITGNHITSINESGSTPITDGEVTEEDIEVAINNAKAVKMPDGLIPLHVIPQTFTVDKQDNIKNPLGLQGVRLSAQIHIIAAQEAWVNNLRKAVEDCGIVVDHIIFSAYASAFSILTDDEKEAGVCLVDFGAGSMDIMVYVDGAVQYSKVLPYGGNDIRDYLVERLGTPSQSAENVKISHGSAMPVPPELLDAYDKKKVEIPSLGGVPKVISKSFVVQDTAHCYGVLMSKIADELLLLRQYLNENGIIPTLKAGVVLTGGAAQINDMAKCASQILGCAVRVGSPQNIAGLTDYVNKPQYATVIGLLLKTYNDDDDAIATDTEGPGVFEPVVKGFRAIYHLIKKNF